MGFSFKNQFVMVAIDLLMISPEINNIAIITIKGADFRCISYGVSKYDATNFLENFVLNESTTITTI